MHLLVCYIYAMCVLLLRCFYQFNVAKFEEGFRLEKRVVETSNLQDDYHEQNS